MAQYKGANRRIIRRGRLKTVSIRPERFFRRPTFTLAPLQTGSRARVSVIAAFEHHAAVPGADVAFVFAAADGFFCRNSSPVARRFLFLRCAVDWKRLTAFKKARWQVSSGDLPGGVGGLARHVGVAARAAVGDADGGVEHFARFGGIERGGGFAHIGVVFCPCLLPSRCCGRRLPQRVWPGRRGVQGRGGRRCRARCRRCWRRRQKQRGAEEEKAGRFCGA